MKGSIGRGRRGGHGGSKWQQLNAVLREEAAGAVSATLEAVAEALMDCVAVLLQNGGCSYVVALERIGAAMARVQGLEKRETEQEGSWDDMPRVQGLEKREIEQGTNWAKVVAELQGVLHPELEEEWKGCGMWGALMGGEKEGDGAGCPLVVDEEKARRTAWDGCHALLHLVLLPDTRIVNSVEE
jgi:hypothetical protein